MYVRVFNKAKARSALERRQDILIKPCIAKFDMPSFFREPLNFSFFRHLLKPQKILLPYFSFFPGQNRAISLKLSKNCGFFRENSAILLIHDEDGMIKFENLLFALLRKIFLVIEVRQESATLKVSFHVHRVSPVTCVGEVFLKVAVVDQVVMGCSDCVAFYRVGYAMESGMDSSVGTSYSEQVSHFKVWAVLN